MYLSVFFLVTCSFGAFSFEFLHRIFIFCFWYAQTLFLAFQNGFVFVNRSITLEVMSCSVLKHHVETPQPNTPGQRQVISCFGILFVCATQPFPQFLSQGLQILNLGSNREKKKMGLSFFGKSRFFDGGPFFCSNFCHCCGYHHVSPRALKFLTQILLMGN